MNAKDVCNFLGISRATLHRRISDGELKPLPKNPAHKKTYRLEFRRTDVEKLAGQSN